MIYSAGDLAVEIDTGTNQPGSILQRLDGGEWRDYEVDGKPVVSPVEIEDLTPGRYRLREK